MVSSGMGAERGVLIRSGEAIQTLKDIKVIVLDKTGTITRGQPSLTEVIAAQGFAEEEVLRAAAAVEAGSEHPLGQAIVTGARERGLELPGLEGFKALTARGVQGRVDGCLVRVGSRRLLDEAGINPGALEDTEPGEKSAFWRSPSGLALGVFLAVAALLLVLEHGAHLLGAWPLLLLLLCAGMHLFMHRLPRLSAARVGETGR